jgi:hypothetical protein
MNLTYRGVRYANYVPAVEAVVTTEPGMFRGVPFAWKRYQIAAAPGKSESLQFLGRSYQR